jgi:signal transduction histidine kinase
VNWIAQLAQDLTDATRVDRNARRLSKADIEVTTLLTDTCEITAAAAAQKKQVLTVSIPDGTLCVEGDPIRLTQVVGNLLFLWQRISETNDCRAARRVHYATMRGTEPSDS